MLSELYQDVFKSLPHVKKIWVTPNGEYYLHPKKGCEVVEAPLVESPNVETTNDGNETKPKKGKK